MILRAIMLVFPGMPCAIQESDKTWYRGVITAISEEKPGMVDVFFVDFGFKKTVRSQTLHRLADKFVHYRKQVNQIF